MLTVTAAFRIGLIAALIALALSIGVVAELERGAAAALATGASGDLAAAQVKLRIGLALLLVAFAALGYLLFAATRSAAAGGKTGTSEVDPLFQTAAASASPPEPTTAIQALPSSEAGRLMAAGALIRRFCHEISNALGPVRGFADLLASDERLTEQHRRQSARIADATATALKAVEDFSAVLGWSKDSKTSANLGEQVRIVAAAARSALGMPIAVAVPPARPVLVVATEAEVGQAMLYLCAAVAPLLGERDIRMELRVDSLIGAPTQTPDDSSGTGQRLEIWSDPFDVERTRVQFGTVQQSWRYGRLQLNCDGHGWSRDVASRLFDPELPEDCDSGCLSMAGLGALMFGLGGVVMIDTCPHRRMQITLLWPTRIEPEVAAPLETDTTGDEIDALIIHDIEAEAEALSRRLGGFGLRVASTTSPEAALDLIAEMESRCRVILVGTTGDAELPAKTKAILPDALVFFLRPGTSSLQMAADTWPVDPDRATLERLATRLLRSGRPGGSSS